MTKRLMQVRVCDKCPIETEAVSTERITLNGESYAIDLCAKHSTELHLYFDRWSSIGTLTKKSSLLEQRRLHTGPRIVSVEPLAKPTPVMTNTEEQEQERQQVPVTPRALPEYPPTAERWHFTSHVVERMEERELSRPQVLWAAERPEVTKPSKSDPNCQARTRGLCTVVVNPWTEEIITAYADDHEPVEATSPAAPLRAGAR